MMPLRLIGATLVLSVAALTLVAASAAGLRPAAQDVTLVIRGGDRIVESNFALAPGVAVRLSITNFTHEFHTFTIPGLGVSAAIAPAGRVPATTVVTFTARRWGTFRWHCAVCPSGAHGRAHAMGGAVYVIMNPSALP